MDRFAQFFVSPLLKRDSISREREAVDSGALSTRTLKKFRRIF